MSESAEEALHIGVNVLIFIVALTSAIMLMTSVLNMTRAMDDIILGKTESTLVNLYGGTVERKYSGDEVLAIVEEYNSPTSNIKEQMIIKVDGGGIIKNVDENFAFEVDGLNKSYSIIYDGIDDGKKIYTFQLINE